jgi:hypothetical protein
VARLLKGSSIIAGKVKEFPCPHEKRKEQKYGYENIEALLQHRLQNNITLFSMSIQIVNNY